MKTNKLMRIAALGLLLGVGATAQKAMAAVITWNFDTLISGPPPVGSSIATLTIADISADNVLVTLNHNATSAAGQFITDLWFNLDPYVTVTPSAQTPAAKFEAFSQGNGTEQNAGLSFDLRQQFVSSGAGGGVNRLKPGESVSFMLNGSGIDAQDFVSPATPQSGQRDDVFAMIHLQGIEGGGSAKLGVVPEPASFFAVGLGIVGLIWRRRRANS